MPQDMKLKRSLCEVCERAGMYGVVKNVRLCKECYLRIEDNGLKAGQRIRFLRTITSNDSEESPGNHYASKGDLGTIDRIGGCWEGFMVFWDGWSQASFGCERKDFELVKD